MIKDFATNCHILGFHVTSHAYPNMDGRHVCAPRSVKFIVIVSHFYIVLSVSSTFCEFTMDLSQERIRDDINKLSSTIPVLSEYAKKLEAHVKRRYLQKISVIGVDPSIMPIEQFDPECLPPIEVSDLLGYLVLETSYYTKQQFKAYKSLEAFNQMVSGFVTSVKGKIISGKYVVVAKVRHSQRMNDPLVNIWIVADSDGTIVSAHCLGCKAGLAESCSHVASVMFYIEAWTRIHGKLACTQVKCTWLLPTYVNEVPYARVKDIDFTSARKLKENLDCKIDSVDKNEVSCRESQSSKSQATTVPSADDINEFYKKLNKCSTKAVALSLVDPYAEQFVSNSRTVPVVSDLYETANLDLEYPELLQKCIAVNLDISEENVGKIEMDTRDQAKSSGFFRHRAGRIGASVCGAAYHSNLAQPPQSLIKSICYPRLFKVSTKATRHGCKHEQNAIKAYTEHMKTRHTKFEVKRCGLFVNKDYPFLHATPDFLMSCDCCGLGCGEVKCPICIQNGDFEKYVLEKSSCLEKVNDTYALKRKHNYYYQVQQQLFTLSDRKFCDFVVCAIDTSGNAHIVIERIYPDQKHWNTVMPKLQAFWRISILPEILGRWYTRRCTLPVIAPGDNGICFCRAQRSNDVVLCSNTNCPYGEFHASCLSLTKVSMPKTWFCPHCSRLPQFKRSKGSSKGKGQPPATIQAALLLNSICLCNKKAVVTDRLLECHSTDCTNGKYFHLSCLGLKRMPNNSKTTWQCAACKQTNAKSSKLPTTSTSSMPATPCSSDDQDSDNEDDISITGVTKGTVDKSSALAQLRDSDYGIILDSNEWLTCDIIQAAQVLLQEVNMLIEGLQRPTLGPVRNFDIVTGEFIQILHTGNNHWVCISSIGCLHGSVHLYDSLYHDVISQEVQDQTNDLLGGNLIGLDFVPVQQQTNGSDCGVFAIAFASCLAFGKDPSHITFDIPRMRPHLAACLKNSEMSMFPVF